MKTRKLMQAALLAAAFCAGGAMAQQTRTAPVTMTDAAPLPAEDRSSNGAIVLENSLVRAQREGAFQSASQRTGVESVGRNVMRITMQQQREADMAKLREDQSIQMQRGMPAVAP